MKTHLTQEFAGSTAAKEAQAIIGKCVHCGFCNATCPTYQLLGDELDGPRGRIYLIKQVLEGGSATRSTQLHLDRCLTCLNCETTCPSGVKYGHLVDIGRAIVDARVARPPSERATRWFLREGLTSALFGAALRLGQALRPLLPSVLKNKIPRRARAHAALESSSRPRKIVMLQGCVQPSMMPNINAAAVRVLAAAGIETVFAHGTGCCGALRTHLGDQEAGRNDMRRNVDAWMPLIASGECFAIVSSASACTLAIKEYGHALAGDANYAKDAALISSLARDLSELLPELTAALKARQRRGPRLAFHSPCTLQHGQHLRGGVEKHLRELGFDLEVPGSESHLCCGSAGAYSILQPLLATQLRDRKLENIIKCDPQVIVSANIGCIQHLQSGTPIPVRHWIEVLDDSLS